MNLSLTSDEDEAAEDPLKKLLRQVYTTHHDKINAVKDTLSSVQEQLEQLKHDNNLLESAVRSKTEENKQLVAENKDLEDQLRGIWQRPPPVCKECEGLRLKVKVLSGIRERIFQCLDLGGADAKGQGRFSRMDTNTLQSIYTQVMDSEMFSEHPEDEVAPSPVKPTKPNVTLRSKESTVSPNKPRKADQTGTKESAVRTAEAKDVTSTKENAPAPDVEEVSPKPKRNLRLPKRANKRSRVTEEGQPNSKRTRTLQTTTENTVKKGTSFHGMLHTDTNNVKLESDTNVSNSAPPRVLAPDTCDMSMDNNNAACLREDIGDNANDKPAERKITAKDRPNLIIPETVPMAFTDDEGEEEDHELNSQSQPLTEQLTVRNIDLSPPSLASTPVCSNRGHPLNLGQSPSKNVQDGARTVDSPTRRPLRHYPSTDSQSYDDDISSDAGSPVFKRNPSMRSEIRQQSVQSPSLFDEDEADIESISSTLPPPPPGVLSKGTKAKMALQNQSKNDSTQNKSNHDLSVSVQSNPSPSMLSGKILSKLKHSENSEWLSTSVSKNSPQPKRDQGKSPLKSKLSGNTKTATHSNDLSSPVRMTRSKKLSQDKGSLNTSKGSNAKSLKQTTIKKGFFQPKKTKLSSLEGFNGGRLAGSQQRQLSREEQELHDLNEAVKRSIDDLKSRQSQDDLGFTEMDVEMTEPQFTSTPFIPQNKGQPRRSSSDDSTSSDTTVFKKPSTPTTPKRRRSKEHDLELRRSPRLKDENSQDDTIDPTVTSPETRRSSKTGETHRKQTSPVNRSLDLSKHEVTNQSLLQANPEVVHANGSLGPDVRLSEWDPDMSAVVTSPQEEHYLEPVSLLDIYSAESENRTQSVRTQQTVVTQRGARTKAAGRQDSDSEDEIELSGGSVVFGSKKTRPGTKGCDLKEKGDLKGEHHAFPESLDDSFDRVPKKKEPEFAHAAVVRKHAERNKLQTYACNECDKYFAGDNASEEEIKRRMANCRHKARYVPPGTPENFWTVGFPDTQECEERGYMNKTQHKPSNHRRKRPFKSLFNAEKESTTASHKASPAVRKTSPGRRPRVMGDVTALFEGDDSQEDDT